MQEEFQQHLFLGGKKKVLSLEPRLTESQDLGIRA